MKARDNNSRNNHCYEINPTSNSSNFSNRIFFFWMSIVKESYERMDNK